MCRSTMENAGFPSYPKDRDRLKIRTFHLRFSISSSAVLPETLTLVYLPRINGNLLEINDAKIRADAPAFVALHRVRSAELTGGSEAVYASTDRIRAGEAVRFEAYVGAEKVLKGVFRRGEGKWRVDCRCATEIGSEKMGISAVEVWVVGEKGVLMREKVEMEGRRRRRKGFCLKLEEIPEEGEGEGEGCDCCCCEEDQWEMVGEGGEWRGGKDWDDGLEMEGVKWAVEMGIWVMCLGVGFLVSKASYKGLRRRKLI